MSKLQACPFTPRAKEIADPFPLNGEGVCGPTAKLPTDVVLPIASLPACSLGPSPEQRPPQTTLHHTRIDSREHLSKQALPHRYSLCRSLGGLWLQAMKHQLKLLTLPVTTPSDGRLSRSQAAKDPPQSYLPSLTL